MAKHLLAAPDAAADPALAERGELDLYLANAMFPIAEAGDVLVCASASVDAKDGLPPRYDKAWFVRSNLGEVHGAIEQRFRAHLSRVASFALAQAEPQLSARRVITSAQLAAGAAIAIAVAAALWLAPGAGSVALAIVLGLAFVANACFRALLFWIGAGQQAAQHFVPLAGDIELPCYTILVPIYREANVVGSLVHALSELDYPESRLQILLVLESDDQETLEAILALELHDPFQIVRVPRGFPRTKPRACNYALNFARGEFTVIYDAEDRPEPDQLKKAVAAFRAKPDEVACLQARLNFYNAARNWLTIMFTLDYSLWFDFLLPGLDRLGVPMPLGGTSNHLRTRVLREINGWDPFNVTEDADLGIRLAEKGYRVSILDSTTYEEAAFTFGNWLRQRSRWLKGYMQTWLVHMRNPARLWRNVGANGFIAFQLFVGGTFASALVNPLLWSLFIASVFFGLHIFSDGSAVAVADFSLFSLFTGNLLFTYLVMLGVVRRGWLQYAPWGLFAFFYWALISLAGYRGFFQLFRNPFHWEKTQHGEELAEAGA